MARARKPPKDEEAPLVAGDEGGDEQELHDEDFQFVLKELLAAYEPILAEALEQARDPGALTNEALQNPPSCDEELQLAERIFERFCTEEIALRLLPPEGREQLGNIESWRWCQRHICCCIKFGWLLCRGPRTFRAWAYYLYRYWLCVRQALGVSPIGRALTPEEREDFNTLVGALAGAFKPYLGEEQASVESAFGLADEVIGGRVDCDEGEEESAAIFERLLTVDIAPALLGQKEVDAHRDDPNFWFGRCWCLCALRSGCYLARARAPRRAARSAVLPPLSAPLLPAAPVRPHGAGGLRDRADGPAAERVAARNGRADRGHGERILLQPLRAAMAQGRLAAHVRRRHE